MQPQNIESRGGQELQQPVEVPSNERVPVLPSPEGGIETGADRREQTAEAQAAAADAAATGVPIQQPIAAPLADEPTAQPVADGPAIAGDEDVIEKEWVDKAKQIIETTKNDPHGRTERVNQLQKDYLKKRYGKELGASG